MTIEQRFTPTLPPHRARFDAGVVENRAICREHFLLALRVTGPGAFPATRPGQFIQLGCRSPQDAPGASVETSELAELEWSPSAMPRPHQPELCGKLALLRRPFSLSGRRDEAGGTILEIVHRVVGVGTDWLSKLVPGQAVDLIGPLGNAFELPRGKSLGLLVGGGVGLPPMFYLAQAMKNASWDGVGFVGAMSRDLLAVTFDKNGAAAEFARLGYPTVVTTNDGSAGMKGLITLGLETHLQKLSKGDLRRAVVFTCGPEPMMRAVAKLAARHGIDCQVCLEQAMACGVGTCQSCVVKIDPAVKNLPPHGQTDTGRAWRFLLACTDGPVFKASDVVW